MATDNVEPLPAASPRRSESTSHDHGSNRKASPAASPAKEEGARSERSEGAVSEDDDPPLPDEPVPDAVDSYWEARFDNNSGAYYFYNSMTGVSQWQNPRLPEPTSNYTSYDRTYAYNAAALPSTSGAPGSSSPPKRKWGGYNPAIHGSYDPNADYAKEAMKEEEEAEEAKTVGLSYPTANHEYAAQAQFNRFTGKFQTAAQGPEMHNDENKSKRQMSAFFDVDAAANSHDGRSLKAERRGKTLTKKELKAFREKRREKKEEKRRAWLLE